MPLTVEAVENAMDEFDEVGETEFLDRYRFSQPREFWVTSPHRRSGTVYPSKPIAARALRWDDINGGYSRPTSACRQLEALGYVITDAVGNPKIDTPSALAKRVEQQILALTPTERSAIIQARIGQGVFRQALLVRWNSQCAFTHLRDLALLRASHIKPWADCDDSERLDVHNGILLSAHLDAAFDEGLISFGDDGEVMVSSELSDDARRELGLGRTDNIWFDEPHLPYLKWHRERVFRK